MTKDEGKRRTTAEVIPLFGRDEMNLCEFPFGPITPSDQKTLRIEHPVFDKKLGREVTRTLIVTGADAFGLPRPIDDQVLIGMKALSAEQRFASRKVAFSRYHLCQLLGWNPDGRAYRRLEESFDRILGTSLKFRDAWWDKGESLWKTEAFHLIESVSLCSENQLLQKRLETKKTEQKLCSFVWNEVVWKSFTDGFMKQLDMEMFRRISKGNNRDVPLRLFRVLDKRFYYGNTVSFDVKRLAFGTLGLSPNYNRAQVKRVLDRAVLWLVQCEYLSRARYYEERGSYRVEFQKKAQTRGVPRPTKRSRRQKHGQQTPKVKTAPTEHDLLLARFESLAGKRRGEVLAAALKHASDRAPSLRDGYERTKHEGRNAHAEYRRLVLVSYLRSSDAPGDVFPVEVSGMKKRAFAI